MNCDGVSNLLSAYLDGELSSGELLRVEEHLRRCHACADEVDSLRQTIALVASLEEVEVPAAFQFNLHERLVALGPPPAAVRRAPAGPSWQRNVRRWAVPAAAAAAALAIGVTQYGSLNNLGAGLAGKPGIFTAKPDPSPAVATTNTTNPPAADPKPAVTPAPGGQSGGGKGIASGKGQPEPSTPAGPGRTDGGSGPKTVTQTGDSLPVVQLAPQYAYSFTLTVAGPLTLDMEATLFTENAIHEKVNNDVVLRVPAVAIDQVTSRLKELFPNASVTRTERNLAAELNDADKAYSQAKRDYDSDVELKETPEKVEQDQKALTAADEYVKLLQSQVKTAVFTLKFQAAQ